MKESAVLGIDAGGTHTDAVLITGNGASPRLAASAKVKTRHDDLPASVREVLAALAGELGGSADAVNAYAASTFYAVDRYASYKQDWGKYYEAGGLLIADRYTTSNAVHQAGKLPDGEREKFLDWLFGFEYGLLGLPEPSLVFYLDVPTELTEKMMREREQATNTKADIHEQDEAYLRACRENAKKVAERCSWQRIGCSKDGAMRTVEDIHEEIYRRVTELLKA